ncbi:MAG: hypothetical protein COA97_06305 [Flavobacteriales bacterium]|nr:MAG: hypothetical protein COA97_06305 [Flavobacteriales bacterium]
MDYPNLTDNRSPYIMKLTTLVLKKPINYCTFLEINNYYNYVYLEINLYIYPTYLEINDKKEHI